MKLTQKDIQKYATEDEKEFLREGHRGYIPLYVKQKKIIDQFIKKHYHDIKRGSMWFDVDKWPELYDAVAAVRETETLYQDINRYVSDKLSEMPWKNRYPWGDAVDKFATAEEKEFLKEVTLKESIADQRAMNFIKASNGDLDEWVRMIRKMSPREIKDATFEFQSAIDGINHNFKHWMIPRKMAKRFGFSDEHWAYRESMERRRSMFRKYLNALKKINPKGEIKYDDFGDEIKEHPDYDPTRDQDVKFESKQIKEAANPKGKTRKIDNPYEVYNGYGALQDWEWKVLKHYQSPEKERSNPYARVFCAVSSPFTFGGYDYGDVYCNQIQGYKYDNEPIKKNLTSGLNMNTQSGKIAD
jgi:hypothetical protein